MGFTSQNLWYLANKGGTTLPILVRGGGNVFQNTNFNIGGSVFGDIKTLSNIRAYNKVGIDVSDYIDIVNNFQWTKSPKTSRTDTPYVELVEKRLLANNILSNIANSILATRDVVKTNLAAPAAAVGSAVTSFQIGQTGAEKLENFITTLASQLDKTQLPLIAGVRDSIKSVIEVFDSSNLQGVLEPYSNLYLVEETGFKYRLPYFENAHDLSSATFGDQNEGLLGGFADLLRSGANIATNLSSFLKPGTYIERSKQFNMGDEGRKISIKFPLLNTGEVLDVNINWQFLFGLIYQNKPGRITRSVIDLPVIYEVNMPGVAFIPYANITSLTINYLGSRRMMDITLPDGFGVKTIKTIVPDAYEVNIELTSLNADTRNFMIAGVNPSPVTVTIDESDAANVFGEGTE